MSNIQHNAIVITSWNEHAIDDAKAHCHSLALFTIGPTPPCVNGFRTLLVPPRGSKSGWEDAEAHDVQREKLRDWLRGYRTENGGAPFEWVEVAYGDTDDERPPRVTHWATDERRSRK